MDFFGCLQLKLFLILSANWDARSGVDDIWIVWCLILHEDGLPAWNWWLPVPNSCPLPTESAFTHRYLLIEMSYLIFIWHHWLCRFVTFGQNQDCLCLRTKLSDLLFVVRFIFTYRWVSKPSFKSQQESKQTYLYATAGEGLYNWDQFTLGRPAKRICTRAHSQVRRQIHSWVAGQSVWLRIEHARLRKHDRRSEWKREQKKKKKMEMKGGEIKEREN